MFFSQVYYRREHGLHEEEQGEQSEQSLMFSGNRSEGRVPGLQPYSVYNISIRVVNSKGEGPAGQSKRFQTPEGGVYSQLDWGSFKKNLLFGFVPRLIPTD